MKYIFADYKEDFIDAMKRIMHGHPDCEFYVGDVKKLVGPNRAYITPANSLLIMDSGLDRVYRDVFPGSERIYREFVKTNGNLSLVGKHYWPIGSALMLEAKKDHFLIAAPTMLMPQPVQNTRNAYAATLAALYLAYRIDRIESIVIPGLCLGWGRMGAETAARQIWWAILDFEASIGSGRYSHVGQVYAFKCPDDYMRDQPKFYENSEFKNIKPADIVAQGRGP